MYDVLFWVISGIALFSCILGFYAVNQWSRWQNRAISHEREANEAADRLVECEQEVLQLCERLASVTVQRDKLSQDVSGLIGGHTRDARNERIVSQWNLRNERIPFQCVEDVLSAAYVHGPRGRLTRLVPKEPTVG